eukprot:2484119-Prymnesium_polylepis.1
MPRGRRAKGCDAATATHATLSNVRGNHKGRALTASLLHRGGRRGPNVRAGGRGVRARAGERGAHREYRQPAGSREPAVS